MKCTQVCRGLRPGRGAGQGLLLQLTDIPQGPAMCHALFWTPEIQKGRQGNLRPLENSDLAYLVRASLGRWRGQSPSWCEAVSQAGLWRNCRWADRKWESILSTPVNHSMARHVTGTQAHLSADHTAGKSGQRKMASWVQKENQSHLLSTPFLSQSGDFDQVTFSPWTLAIRPLSKAPSKS